MTKSSGRIYFSEDMGFTSSDRVDADDIITRNGWVTFTIGKGKYWEDTVTVPESKVKYIK